jgi:hypothetical protein
MSPTPQDTATGEAGLRSLSNAGLAALWIASLKLDTDDQAVLVEFARRYWAEQEERAACGDVLRLHPAFKVLPDPKPSALQVDGPEVFAS